MNHIAQALGDQCFHFAPLGKSGPKLNNTKLVEYATVALVGSFFLLREFYFIKLLALALPAIPVPRLFPPGVLI